MVKSAFKFVRGAADKAVRFFREKLCHTVGEFAGKPFDLLPWQRTVVRDLFGWKRADGSRRYRTAYIEIPRKNGKSTFAAGLALYLMLEDGEPQAQIYSAAGDRMQARIVFDTARAMVAANPGLATRVDTYQYDLRGLELGGKYQAVSAEAYSKHGFNAHGIIFDELHVQPNRDLWDVLTTSTGARRQPLTVAITTAGHDRSSICWELHQRARSVADNPEADPSFYGVIYGADDTDDWASPTVWQKANPSLGKSLKLDYLREKCQEARDNPPAENTFRNLHLNQWTEQAVRWLPMHEWDSCVGVVSEGELVAAPCWAGLDLAATRDVNALSLVFPLDRGRYALKCFYFAPKAMKDKRGQQDRRQVLNWMERGLIKGLPGDVTDYACLADEIESICQVYAVQLIAYDPWGPARAMAQLLGQRGISTEVLREFKQTIANYSAPMKEFLRLVQARKLDHFGDPVLRWMASNVAAKEDVSGNIRPDKAASSDKIDGIVASLMGLGLALDAEPVAVSPYETRGVKYTWEVEDDD